MNSPYRIAGFNGARIGRPPKLSPRQVKIMVAALERGMTIPGLARRFRVCKATIERYLRLAAGKPA